MALSARRHAHVTSHLFPFILSEWKVWNTIHRGLIQESVNTIALSHKDQRNKEFRKDSLGIEAGGHRKICESPASSLAVICEPLASCLRDLRVLASPLRYLSKTISLRLMNSLSASYCLLSHYLRCYFILGALNRREGRN